MQLLTWGGEPTVFENYTNKAMQFNPYIFSLYLYVTYAGKLLLGDFLIMINADD